MPSEGVEYLACFVNGVRHSASACYCFARLVGRLALEGATLSNGTSGLPCCCANIQVKRFGSASPLALVVRWVPLGIMVYMGVPCAAFSAAVSSIMRAMGISTSLSP